MAGLVAFIFSMIVSTLDIAWKTLVVLIVAQWFLYHYPISIYHP